MRVLEDFAIAGRTSLKVGGAARYFAEPESVDELVRAVSDFRDRGLSIFTLGGGTNTLVDDGGFEGAVLSTRRLSTVETNDERRTIICDAGVPLSRAIRNAIAKGWGGLETYVGIPGTVGGAAHGNAGGPTGGIGAFVRGVEVVRDGRLEWIPGDEIPWRYRHSGLRGEVIARVHFGGEPEDPAVMRARSKEVFLRKNATQPLSARSAGCVFRNPDGDSAGRLIEAAGLKGFRVGGAEVSERHANFVVNREGASSRDVQAVIDALRARVRERFGVALRTEIIRLENPARGSIEEA